MGSYRVVTESLKRNYKRRDNKETFDNQSEGVIDLIFRTVFVPKIPSLSVCSEQDIPVRGRTGRSRGLEGKAGIKGTGGGRVVSTTVDRDLVSVTIHRC